MNHPPNDFEQYSNVQWLNADFPLVQEEACRIVDLRYATVEELVRELKRRRDDGDSVIEQLRLAELG